MLVRVTVVKSTRTILCPHFYDPSNTTFFGCVKLISINRSTHENNQNAKMFLVILLCCQQTKQLLSCCSVKRTLINIKVTGLCIHHQIMTKRLGPSPCCSHLLRKWLKVSGGSQAKSIGLWWTSQKDQTGCIDWYHRPRISGMQSIPCQSTILTNNVD